MQKKISLFATVFIFHSLCAQYEEKDFIHYTVKDGLSDNYITCLQQDGLGYIWAGTGVGLNRFDGNSFKKFYQGTAPLSLLSGVIWNLKPFGHQQLGILSYGGLQVLNTKDLSMKNYIIPDSTAFSTKLNLAWDAIQLPGGSVALTTASGFYFFNKPGQLDFRYDAYSQNDIGKKEIRYGREILPMNDKEYLVCTEEGGLADYDAEKRSFREISRDGNDPLATRWKIFSHLLNVQSEQMISKYEFNGHEFIFAFKQKDSIVYYNYALQKVVISPLPFHSTSELTWESKIEMINDSTFLINANSYGFYLLHLDRQTGQITCTGKKYLASYKINRLFLDKDKRLWVATSEGLLQQKLNTPLISSYHFPPVAGDTLTGGFICAYRYQNKLYASRYSLNKGLMILNPTTMQVEKQIAIYGGHNGWNEIVSMEMYHKDTLWLGTSSGLLWFDTKTERYDKVLDEKKYPWATGMSVMLAPANKDGYAWMCGILNGLVVRYHIASRTFTHYTPKTQPALPFDREKRVVYDSYGDVWISGHALTRWNSRREIFDTLITVYGGRNKFNDDILTLSADDNGSIWLHNAENGLLEYRIKEKKFVAYSMNDGLPSDVLTCFSPVIGNNLWIGSNSHLSKFDTRTKKIIVYDQQDGLPVNKPSGRKIYFDKEDNLLYMLSGEYIVKIPTGPYNAIDSSSGILAEELVINNSKHFFQPDEGMKLKYNENNLSLNYSVIDFENNNYQFAYKINNDRVWNNLSTQHTLNLNNLQPGNYSIQIKATGKSGNEKLKTFMVMIRPPFWNTTWFLLACSILLAAGLYYFYRSRIKQVRQKANIDKLLAQTEMKALHAQMNPHFIFNSLNSIREMILNNENKEASHFLSKFAHLIRVTLDQSGESFISLRNTIDYLHRYIEMEQIRNSHFTSRILADEELDMDESILPPMLIQPFIENAIWHGTTGSKKDININIDFKKQNKQLVCIIEDNGIGIEQSLQLKKDDRDLHNPVGIVNIKNRIRLLNEKYNLQCSLTIEDKTRLAGYTETGTVVTLQLPLEITAE